jgi:acetyl-CoA carboxylase carboxyl transferase subunit beta
VLYSTDLEKNLNVCPKCGDHQRIGARARLDGLLDPEGRFEIGAEVLPVDTLKFKDSRKYPERLEEAQASTGETDALIVLQGSIKSLGVVCAAFEFDFMGGSMGSVVGERFVRGVRVAIEQKSPFVCFTSTGGARMQEGRCRSHRWHISCLADRARGRAASSPCCRIRDGRRSAFAMLEARYPEPKALIGCRPARHRESRRAPEGAGGFQRRVLPRRAHRHAWTAGSCATSAHAARAAAGKPDQSQ